MSQRLLVLMLMMLAAAGPASRSADQPEWTLRDGAVPALQALIERQPVARPAAIQRLQTAIAASKKELANARGPGAQSLRERIGELNRQVADLRARKIIATDASMELPPQIEVGWAGAGLGSRLRCRVERVVDDQNAIVEVLYESYVGDIRRPITINKSVTFWLAGVPTAGWADERQVELPALLVADGVHEAGRSTIIELRPFSQDDFVHHDGAPRQPDQKLPTRP